MDSVALVLDVEEVRRHGQPYNGNEVIYGELPCHEVGGFGHFRHSPSRPVCSVKDWPIIWAVAIIDEAYDQFCFHDGFATLREAQSEAHRLATNRLHEQSLRHNFLRGRYGPNVLGADAFGMAHDPYVRFEALLKWEKVLFGPLTDAGAATFAQWHGAAELAEDIAELQHRLAIEKLLVFTRIFQGLAVDARRRIASFVFTPRAMPGAARTSKEEVQIAFDLTSPYKSVPRFSGRWIAPVPNDATVNDVARMVHRQLWGFTDENDEEGGSLAVLPDSVLQETSVLLCGSDDSEQALFDPRQRTHVSPYIDGARLFRPDRLPTHDGLPLVRAIAFRM